MKKYTAELVGTFALVFGGVGSAVLAGGKIGYLGVSFAFGLSLLAMVYTIGPISGCHINAAVTFGMLVSKKIGAKDAAAYMVAQVIGAVILRCQQCGGRTESHCRRVGRERVRRAFAPVVFDGRGHAR